MELFVNLQTFTRNYNEQHDFFDKLESRVFSFLQKLLTYQLSKNENTVLTLYSQRRAIACLMNEFARNVSSRRVFEKLVENF